jgi:hypothetical protein
MALIDLLIRNTHVLNVSASGEIDIRRDQDVAIQRNRIQAVEPAGTISPDALKRSSRLTAC